MYSMDTSKDERVNLKVSRKCQVELKKLGFFGETYEDIIWRLIKKQVKRQNKQKPSKFEENL